MKLSEGTKLLLIYILIYLIVAGCGYELIGNKSGIYKLLEWNYIALGLFIAVVLFALNNKEKQVTRYYFANFLSLEKQISIIIALDIISFLGYFSGNTGFRYASEGMSESGGLLIFFFATVNTALNFFMLVYLYYCPGYVMGKGLKPFVLKVAFSIGIILSINGNATTLLALLFFASIFFPNTFNNIIFKTKDSKDILPIISRWIFTILLLPALVLANIYGESIKTDADTYMRFDNFDFDIYMEGLLTYIFSFVLSPNYISFKATLTTYAFSLDFTSFYETLIIPLESFVFRLDTLMGHPFGIVKSSISSINRLNYTLITEDYLLREREGTSPGFFATFFLCFPFPLNFILLYFGIRFFKKYTDILLNAMPYKFTIWGMIIFLYFFIMPIISSPIDVFVVIDNIVIYCLGFFFIIKYSIKKVNA